MPTSSMAVWATTRSPTHSTPDAGIDSYNGGAGVDYLTFNRSDSTGLTINLDEMAIDAGQTLADGTIVRNIEGL